MAEEKAKETTTEKPSDRKDPESLLELEYNQPSLNQLLFVLERFLDNNLRRYKSFLKRYLKAGKITLTLFNRYLHVAKEKNQQWVTLVRERFMPKVQ